MAFEPAKYEQELIIADGDCRGELHSRGWPEGTVPERANLERPDMVADVAETFLDAGVKVLVTNTAGANALALAEQIKEGTTGEKEILKMNHQGAAIYRQAVSDHPVPGLLVFGAVGPIERLLLLDEIGESALSEAYARQAEALAAGGADAILCRSFVEVGALVVAIRAAIQATGLPVIGSMTFDSGPEQVETALGTTVPQACAEMAEAGAAVVGCDCGDSPDSTPAVVSLIRQSCGLPIWVKVDAGLPELVEGRVVYPETPAEFAGRLKPLAQEGANFVGGCCGASASHVAALATIRNQPRRKQR